MTHPRIIRRWLILIACVVAAVFFGAGLNAADIAGTYGTFTVSVTNGRISISFKPDPAKVSCNSIYLVQTCKDTDQNGKTIQPKDYKGNKFRWLQDDMTPGGTYVDHVFCEKDPFYNGEDAGKDVKSQGTTSPNVNSTSMSDKPRYGSGIYPDGVTKIKSTFEVCAVCKSPYAVYDCVTWTYEQEKGKSGTTTAPTATHKPSKEFKGAVTGYKKNHKDGTICPEEEAKKNKDKPKSKNVKPGGKKAIEYVQSGTTFQMDWYVSNSSLNEVTNVDWLVIIDDVDTAGMGTISYLDYIDQELVSFDVDVPAAPADYNLLMLVDPDNHIDEYDEEDNWDIVYFTAVEDTCALNLPGDVDDDGIIAVADLVLLTNFIMSGGEEPPKIANGDVNGDCCVDEADVQYFADFYSSGGEPPVECTCIDPQIGPCTCCEVPGDANNDQACGIGDVVYLINNIFRPEQCGINPPMGCSPECLAEGDANADGSVNIGDAVYLNNFIFRPADCDVNPPIGCPPVCGPEK